MGFVAGKCPCCGANLSVDPSQDAAICDYCGNPFVVKKAISTTNVNIPNMYADNINTKSTNYVKVNGVRYNSGTNYNQSNYNGVNNNLYDQTSNIEHHIYEPDSKLTKMAKYISYGLQNEAYMRPYRRERFKNEVKETATRLVVSYVIVLIIVLIIISMMIK
ncbi:hypothetical protein [Butyrivibrio sp. FC2001]|uniref:hypothetical protein n=1 Tax=Butyrivibrio sp. FC2001 TaxID=1280671 RepID=UPI000479C64B|nr:hypothetical protein [Butyrivibrio sp. FC2001]